MFSIGFETLTGEEVEKDTYFATRMKDQWISMDSDDVYFIDRDPTHMELILNYLRGYKVDTMISTMNQRDFTSLLCEVDFYLLVKLKSLIEREYQKFQQLVLDMILDSGGAKIQQTICLKDGRILSFTKTGTIRVWSKDGMPDEDDGDKGTWFDVRVPGIEIEFMSCVQLPDETIAFGIQVGGRAQIVIVVLDTRETTIMDNFTHEFPGKIDTMELVHNYLLCVTFKTTTSSSIYIYVWSEYDRQHYRTTIWSIDNIDMLVCVYADDHYLCISNRERTPQFVFLNSNEYHPSTPNLKPSNGIKLSTTTCHAAICLKDGRIATGSRRCANIWKIDGVCEVKFEHPRWITANKRFYIFYSYGRGDCSQVLIVG